MGAPGLLAEPPIVSAVTGRMMEHEQPLNLGFFGDLTGKAGGQMIAALRPGEVGIV